MLRHSECGAGDVGCGPPLQFGWLGPFDFLIPNVVNRKRTRVKSSWRRHVVGTAVMYLLMRIAFVCVSSFETGRIWNRRRSEQARYGIGSPVAISYRSGGDKVAVFACWRAACGPQSVGDTDDDVHK
ncbi:hypothetical protein GW17_00041319 [Ensete ventricosum]|nr:hypothetical protein GW17_00041319 [Ensete ventricosum]